MSDRKAVYLYASQEDMYLVAQLLAACVIVEKTAKPHAVCEWLAGLGCSGVPVFLVEVLSRSSEFNSAAERAGERVYYIELAANAREVVKRLFKDMPFFPPSDQWVFRMIPRNMSDAAQVMESIIAAKHTCDNLHVQMAVAVTDMLDPQYSIFLSAYETLEHTGQAVDRLRASWLAVTLRIKSLVDLELTNSSEAWPRSRRWLARFELLWPLDLIEMDRVAEVLETAFPDSTGNIETVSLVAKANQEASAVLERAVHIHKQWHGMCSLRTVVVYLEANNEVLEAVLAWMEARLAVWSKRKKARFPRLCIQLMCTDTQHDQAIAQKTGHMSRLIEVMAATHAAANANVELVLTPFSEQAQQVLESWGSDGLAECVVQAKE